MKFNAKELRDLDEAKIQEKLSILKRNPIYFILENIYDTYNVGGIFRLADALFVSKIFLCGQTDTPPNTRIKKASIGTYKVVPWEYKQSSEEAIVELRKGKGERGKGKVNTSPFTLNPKPYIVAIEQDKRAVSYTTIKYKAPVALIFGNETYGVRSETLDMVDAIAEIPMWGVNQSLNVIVSAAIVGYWVAAKEFKAGE